MNMGVLFNFYTTPTFTLPGQGMKPGQHTLTFDLASNTHVDIEATVTNVAINYQPATAKAAPQASASSRSPEVTVVWPPNGATLRPLFTLLVSKNNFAPSLELEGKPNLAGYGHYHIFVIFVDMPMMDMTGGSDVGMMSMIGMPGTDSIPVDLSASPQRAAHDHCRARAERPHTDSGSRQESWTELENWYLGEGLGVISRAELARDLHRTTDAVHRRLYDLGLHSYQRWGWTLHRVERVAQVPRHQLQTYIERGDPEPQWMARVEFPSQHTRSRGPRVTHTLPLAYLRRSEPPS
jgi:hypothetical protein